MDIATNLEMYLLGNDSTGDRDPNARYASFDFCFNYFQAFRESGNTAALANEQNLQVSCLQLGFYLASWGMYRGSTNLLKKSGRHLSLVIKEIASIEQLAWEVDADSYNTSNIECLLDTAARLRSANGGMTGTLITKVMLGVFGNVPAFDANFKRGSGFGSFGRKALIRIGDFYQENAKLIDEYLVPTLDFTTGKPTHRRYTRAKVIDMVFFIQGMLR